MTAGITGYGSYIPRLRLSRQAVAQANAWYAPQFAGRKGTRSMANWDEDSITMAVAAARDCLGAGDDRGHIRSVQLVSSTLPFAERWDVSVYGDVGAGDSDLTWQLATLVGLHWDVWGVAAGYRILDYEFESGSDNMDVAFEGLLIGVEFRF